VHLGLSCANCTLGLFISQGESDGGLGKRPTVRKALTVATSAGVMEQMGVLGRRLFEGGACVKTR